MIMYFIIFVYEPYGFVMRNHAILEFFISITCGNNFVNRRIWFCCCFFDLIFIFNYNNLKQNKRNDFKAFTWNFVVEICSKCTFNKMQNIQRKILIIVFKIAMDNIYNFKKLYGSIFTLYHFD